MLARNPKMTRYYRQGIFIDTTFLKNDTILYTLNFKITIILLLYFVDIWEIWKFCTESPRIPIFKIIFCPTEKRNSASFLPFPKSKMKKVETYTFNLPK